VTLVAGGRGRCAQDGHGPSVSIGQRPSPSCGTIIQPHRSSARAKASAFGPEIRAVANIVPAPVGVIPILNGFVHGFHSWLTPQQQALQLNFGNQIMRPIAPQLKGADASGLGESREALGSRLTLWRIGPMFAGRGPPAKSRAPNAPGPAESLAERVELRTARPQLANARCMPEWYHEQTEGIVEIVRNAFPDPGEKSRPVARDMHRDIHRQVIDAVGGIEGERLFAPDSPLDGGNDELHPARCLAGLICTPGGIDAFIALLASKRRRCGRSTRTLCLPSQML
jgi:hypothetical protein